MENLNITVAFPYPSGEGLHAGHWYNYAIIDSYCRYKRYIGHEVFQPFGYDSFGLPAENYARKTGGNVKDITKHNIHNFNLQMKSMNTMFQTILSTHTDEYKKYTWYLFDVLRRKGLAYKAFGEQDYCSSCETVLAREQVIEGKCERCGSECSKKILEQWYFKITEYKDRLIKGLDHIDYPISTINQQRKWLENIHDWCVSRQRKWGCEIPIEGESDTLDTFVDSSIYFIIYQSLIGIKPKQVDLYVIGKEHACMHLIYARFITMVLFDNGDIDFEEPFKKVVHQGMILKDGNKMSKSKGNTVNLDQYDADEIRFYLMFIGHYFDGGEWSDKNINGIKRFISKIKTWLSESGDEEININVFKDKIFEFTEKFKFNRVVSEFMILLNENKKKKISKNNIEELTMLLRIYIPGFNI